LREFWERVSSRLLAWPLSNDDNSRRIFNETSAVLVAAGGAPGFLRSAAFLLPYSCLRARPEAISLYDTEPLRATLEELVDFDLLNSGAVRLSVGAVQVLSGNMKYFDTQKMRIGPEHIMASGALPPGFPPIEIDGQPYWDGGLVSNTPLEFVLERTGPRDDMVIFQIDLFSAKGCMPENLFDIGQREKGDPLFEPHQAQHRYLPRDADHPQGHSSLAGESAAGIVRQPRLAVPRQRKL
jgi:NTE family protein